jgi:Pyruvate/2-oxoacid:ferredoxin oxidoreductase delta subunit
LSSQTQLSRRAFLGFLRKKEQPAPPPQPVPAPAPAPGGGFSLDAFYSARAQSGETTGNQLPVFSLREGLVVPQEGVSRIGMAPRPVRVRPQLCLAWQGSFCSTCSERCPVEDAIVIEAGRPRVVEERCNGCGLCVQVCPAPLNALELAPSRSPQVSHE